MQPNAHNSLSGREAPRLAEDTRIRIAPYNLEAEQALLGAILVNNEAHDRVSSFLTAEHFYDPLHGQIYETAARLIASGVRANPITMRTYFESSPDLPGMTVPQYLGSLAASATTIINAHDYGRTIRDLATRRSLIVIGEDMVNAAHDSPVDFDPAQQIEEAEGQLYALAEGGRFGSGFADFSSALVSTIEMAARACQRGGGLSGLATGLVDLDSKMGGLQSSDLIIIAGRPSMGKTALATNIAFNVAKSLQKGSGVVGFFSLEMSSEQLATRILAEQAGLSSQSIRRGDLSEDAFKDLTEVARTLSSLPLLIDQSGGISIAQLAARARRLKRQHGLALLVVDYIQLLSGPSKRSGNRVQEISEITTGLKALAKELAIPVIALSQLSRQVEQRQDKRPQLSDLRESGAIEQDADVVMFVYREEYYVERSKPAEGTSEFGAWMEQMSQCAGRADVIIGKQRHGPVGTVTLAFDGKFTRFADLARDQYVPENML